MIEIEKELLQEAIDELKLAQEDYYVESTARLILKLESILHPTYSRPTY